MKRFVDIIGAIVGLTIGFPFVLIFGTLVYLESKGPIFFKQIRIGKNGKPFIMFKVRSMVLSAGKDRMGWTKPNDTRVLKIGKIIRKWNIDEIPQFWNVLKGDMSLVGPRPERPEWIQVFKDFILQYETRHSVKPGMSGWAQIHGLRGDTCIKERIEYDLYYINNQTIFLDFYIMLETILKLNKHY